MKVAIVVPSGTMVHMEFATSLVGLARKSECDIAISNPRTSMIELSRHIGVESALEDGADYILFLDSDMSFPDDTLNRLLAHDKDIVGCNYVQRHHPHKSMAYVTEIKDEPLVEVTKIPTGVMLIKRKVFDGMSKPYFYHPVKDGDIVGEDYDFCERARLHGFSVWMDVLLSLEVIHWGEMGFRWKGDGFACVELK